MPTIDELTIADEPASWAALGFAVDGDACRIGAVTLRLAGRDAGRGLVGWSLRDVSSTELDGLPTTRSERPLPATPDAGAAAGASAAWPPDAAAPPQHPNGVTRIDHVVAISPQLDRTVAVLQAAGLDLRRIREEPTPAGAPRQAFFRLGAEILEVIQEPAEVSGRAGGPDRPAIFWGLALRVADLETSVAGLGEHASEIRDAVQPGRRIASLRRSAGLALPLALMTA